FRSRDVIHLVRVDVAAGAELGERRLVEAPPLRAPRVRANPHQAGVRRLDLHRLQAVIVHLDRRDPVGEVDGELERLAQIRVLDPLRLHASSLSSPWSLLDLPSVAIARPAKPVATVQRDLRPVPAGRCDDLARYVPDPFRVITVLDQAELI